MIRKIPVLALVEETTERIDTAGPEAAEAPRDVRVADWRAGRLAARRAAAELLGVQDSERIEITRPGGGAPRVFIRENANSRQASLAVSISHRDGRAVAAATSAGVRVGVDLERAGSIPLRYTRYFLTPAERERAADHDPAELWALKEAAWKALDCGEADAFTALELQFGDDAEVQAVSFGGRTRPARARLSTPWPGYVLAVFWAPEDDR